MISKLLPTVAIILLVLVAGCTGGISGTADDGTPSPTSTSTAATTNPGGMVQFYISDEENAIGDFKHLNVTVTRVGFERAGADGGGWVEREVDNETVDLTELQGANATLIDEYKVQNGTYSTVFVHVGEVNATLQNGEQVRVKLPSEKLQIKKEFTVDNGSQVNFVFDIAVHKAGNSGKYILKPVITESGTDVPIESIDGDDRDDGLNATFVGNVSQGENATIEVTRNGRPVANATVSVNDEAVGTTDTDGRITFEVPRDEDVEVDVMKGDAETELEVVLETEDANDESEDDREVEALNATFVGSISQGENATLSVTQNGSAVANATVIVNDEMVGTTDAEGELTFTVPTTETMTVVVQTGGEEVELEQEFEEDNS